MKTTVLDRQDLLDLAVQLYGTAEAAIELALLNNMSLTDELVSGQPLLSEPLAELVETNGSTDKAIADYYANRQLKPATGMTEEQMNNTVGYGIEFMGIEIDFIVS